jgi:flagellar hook-basal body complex protein FliE
MFNLRQQQRRPRFDRAPEEYDMKALEQISNVSSTTVTAALDRAADMAERAGGGGAVGRSHAGPSFAERMSDSLDNVARTQNDAAQLVRDYETGKETDLTKVMVAQQVSSLSFQMTLNVRNKALTAYKDIMNMPV